ncbi:unnamed protein product [Schistosoma margrebowiei]|uniref:DUF6451 domain-containing protein n=1 Tax=Schistosoma margrebowiei TaxID=48269 RepID=A0A3P8EZE6_9TREM|nr:unnamed protein product [Schistosoma margrebowiei]
MNSFRQVIMPKSDDPSKKQFEEAKRLAGVPIEWDKLLTDSLKLAFQKEDIDFDDDAMLLECYYNHIKTLQENIPSVRLLVHRLGDGWEPFWKLVCSLTAKAVADDVRRMDVDDASQHHHKEWITVDTLDKNQWRKSMMAAMNTSRKRAEKVKAQAEYTEVIKQVKRSIRTDKRKYVEDLAVTAGKTVREGNMRSERSDLDVKARIGKARVAYLQLKNIWNSKRLSINSKVRFFNSTVKTVLLWGRNLENYESYFPEDTVKIMSKTPSSISVIVTGLPRTGTTSMKKALEIIYNQPCYHGYELVTRKQCDIAKWQMLIDGVRTTRCEEKIHKCLSEMLVGYRSMSNIQVCGLYKELMTLYPDAKVVLTVRDKNDWLISLRQVVMPKSDDPRKIHMDEAKRRAGIPVEFDKLLIDSLKLAFQKEDIDFDDDAMLLECYEKHIKTLQENIPSERLLVYHIGDGWEPLCRFLNVHVPANKPYPKMNQRSDMIKLRDLIKKFGSIEEVARIHPGIV